MFRASAKKRQYEAKTPTLRAGGKHSRVSDGSWVIAEDKSRGDDQGNEEV